MGTVVNNRTPVKSEQTALVCWGLKGLNEMKTGLIVYFWHRPPSTEPYLTSLAALLFASFS